MIFFWTIKHKDRFKIRSTTLHDAASEILTFRIKSLAHAVCYIYILYALHDAFADRHWKHKIRFLFFISTEKQSYWTSIRCWQRLSSYWGCVPLSQAAKWHISVTFEYKQFSKNAYWKKCQNWTRYQTFVQRKKCSENCHKPRTNFALSYMIARNFSTVVVFFSLNVIMENKTSNV